MGGERVQTRTVIWTAGVAASPAAHWLGAQSDRAGRVNVTDHLRLPAHPNVFVIGDTAGVSQQGKSLPGVAPVAMQEGRYVAQAIRRQVAGKDHRPPFRYHDRGNLATVGRAFGVVVLGPVQLTGWLAWLLWLSVHIFYLIGFRNRLMVLFQWAWAYVTRQRSARLITCEPSAEQDGEECVSPGMSPVRPAHATVPGEKGFVPALSEKEAVCPS
jgi:NADH dehydrogenase